MSFTRRVIGGAAWGQAGQMTAMALAMVTQIVLARGLGRDDYGLFAALNGAVFLTLSLASGGAGPTLNAHLGRMRKQYGPPAAAYLFIRMWFWRLVVFCTVALLVVAFARPVASAFLGDPDLSGLIVAAVLYMVTVGLFLTVNMFFMGLLHVKEATVGAALSAGVNTAISALDALP